MYSISYNGLDDYKYNLRPATKVLPPATERNYTAYKIPGRDGELLSFDGTVKDTSLTVEMSVAAPMAYAYRSYGLQRCLQYARQWVYSDGNRRLILSDDPNSFYHVKNASIANLTRKTRDTATLNVVFTIDGYAYTVDHWDTWRTITDGYSYDRGLGAELSHPLYRILGSGVTEISVGNGSPVSINLPDTNAVIIDTDLMIAYREDTGATMSTCVTGDYSDLWIPQVAVFHIDGNSEVKLKARSRRRL